MSVHDDILSFLSDHLREPTEEGAVSKILVEHKDASGRDTDIFHIKSGTAAWQSAEHMTQAIVRVADRHARGLVGAQQYRVCLFFGASDRPSRQQPFGMAGITQFGPIPGGYSTEGANPTGQMQQTMRQAELIVQGAFSERKHTFETLMALIRDLASLVKDREEALKISNGELRDCWVAIKELTASFMEIATKVQVDVINAKRNAELLTDAAGLLPAAVNGVTGKAIFPVAAADTELMRKMVKVVDNAPGAGEKMLEAMSKLAQDSGTEGQTAWAMFVGRLDEIRKDSLVRGKKIEQMAGEAAGTDYANALKDASGRAVTSLRNAGRKEETNGHAPPPAPTPAAEIAQPAQPTVEGDAADPFAAFGEELLTALDGPLGEMALGALRSSGKTALADKAERLRDVLKARESQK